MTARKTPKLDQLAEHEQRVTAVQQRARSLGRDLAELAGKVSEFKHQKIDAHSREDEQLAAKIREQIDAAESKVIDLEERQAGAELAGRRADPERAKWTADHYHELAVELEPDAKRVAKAIDDLADQLLSALSDWQDVSGRVSNLAHVAGQQERVPNLGWDEISRSLRRRPKPTVLPLPGPRMAVDVVEHDHPDPEIREAARQAIQEKAGRR